MSLKFNIAELVYKFTFHGGYFDQRVEGRKMLRLKKIKCGAHRPRVVAGLEPSGVMGRGIVSLN